MHCGKVRRREHMARKSHEQQKKRRKKEKKKVRNWATTHLTMFCLYNLFQKYTKTM